MQRRAIISLARALLEQDSPGYQLHVAYRDSFSWDEWPALRSACQKLAEDCGCTPLQSRWVLALGKDGASPPVAFGGGRVTAYFPAPTRFIRSGWASPRAALELIGQ